MPPITKKIAGPHDSARNVWAIVYDQASDLYFEGTTYESFGTTPLVEPDGISPGSGHFRATAERVLTSKKSHYVLSLPDEAIDESATGELSVMFFDHTDSADTDTYGDEVGQGGFIGPKAVSVSYSPVVKWPKFITDGVPSNALLGFVWDRPVTGVVVSAIRNSDSAAVPAVIITTGSIYNFVADIDLSSANAQVGDLIEIEIQGTWGGNTYIQRRELLVTDSVADELETDTAFRTATFSGIADELETDAPYLAAVAGDVTTTLTADAPYLASVADQVRVELATELGRIDIVMSDIPAAVEAAIVDEGDATAVLQAIADKIADDLTVGDLTTLAIAAAVRTELTTELGRIDVATSTRAPATDMTTALGNQAAIVTILADMSGATFDTATDSLEAIRDRGDAEWTTGGSGVTDWTGPEKDQIRDALGVTGVTTPTSGSGSLETDLATIISTGGAGPWTQGVGGGGGGDATLANQTTMLGHLTDLKGGGFVGGTDSNEAIRGAVDGAVATGGAGPWTTGGVGTVVAGYATGGESDYSVPAPLIWAIPSSGATAGNIVENLPTGVQSVVEMTFAGALANDAIVSVAGVIDELGTLPAGSIKAIQITPDHKAIHIILNSPSSGTHRLVCHVVTTDEASIISGKGNLTIV